MIKVIHVDDQEFILEIVLKRLSYYYPRIAVTSFSSVAEALEGMEENEYDLILSDYEMPEIDGLEFLRMIKNSKYRDIPFGFFTSKGDERSTKQKLIDEGACFVRTKRCNSSDYVSLTCAICRAVEEVRGLTYELKMSYFSKNVRESVEKAIMRMVKALNLEVLFVDLSTDEGDIWLYSNDFSLSSKKVKRLFDLVEKDEKFQMCFKLESDIQYRDSTKGLAIGFRKKEFNEEEKRKLYVLGGLICSDIMQSKNDETIQKNG